MVFRNASTLTLALALMALPAAAATTPTATTTKKPAAKTALAKPASSHLARTSARSHHKHGVKPRGQATIDPMRAREIQSALIRDHYLEGQPNGAWDDRTRAAMVRYQADNGWQTKKVPDSRAIIKLGLGPDHADLINPNTAFVQPAPTGKGGAPQLQH